MCWILVMKFSILWICYASPTRFGHANESTLLPALWQQAWCLRHMLSLHAVKPEPRDVEPTTTKHQTIRGAYTNSRSAGTETDVRRSTYLGSLLFWYHRLSLNWYLFWLPGRCSALRHTLLYSLWCSINGWACSSSWERWLRFLCRYSWGCGLCRHQSLPTVQMLLCYLCDGIVANRGCPFYCLAPFCFSEFIN